LKETSEVAVVTLFGRLFHARLAVTWKDQSPTVLCRVLGIISRWWGLDQKGRGRVTWTI